MKTQLNFKNTRFSWLKKPCASHSLRTWLTDTGSLTARLQSKYNHFAVKPVTVKYAKPLSDESVLLHLPAHKVALIREVLLLGNHQAVIFAHSVLPRASLRGKWNGLGRLGNQPLGVSLFTNPQVKRAPLRFKKLAPHHALYQHAVQHLVTKPAYLWARRSVFSLNCATILVTEVFLPQLLSK